MQYHRGFIGHLAAQKHYTSSFLRHWQQGSWNISDILHAAGCYSKIHELSWDCWRVVGGYWRKPETQIPLFRDKRQRGQAIAIIRQMQEYDRQAVAHLQAALDAWDKSHATYIQPQ